MNLLSIGVIGGADGPTAILVTSNISTELIIIGIATIVVLIAIVVWIIKRHKKK